MANTNITMQEVAEDFLIEFKNNLLVVGTSDKQFEADMTRAHTDTGGSITIRKRVRYNVGDGATISSVDDREEKSTSLTIDKRKHVATDVTSREMTFDVKDRFNERVVAPMAKALANKVDRDLATDIGKEINYFTGTAGTRPSAYIDASDVAAGMDLLGMPSEERWIGFGPLAYSSFISSSTLQNSFDQQLNRDITRNGQLGRIADMQSYKSVYVPRQLAGVGDSSATPSNGFVDAGNVKTIVTSGNTIVIENLQPSTTGVFNPGDKIQIAGVFSVNPGPDHVSTGIPMQFTITNTSAVDSDVSGEATITVSPSIISDVGGDNPYRNISDPTGIQGGVTSAVSLASANSAAGASDTPYEVNIAYNKGGIVFAAPPLALPFGVPAADMGTKTDPETGISIRMVRYYGGNNDTSTIRADVIYGYDLQQDFMYGLLG